MIFYMIYLVRAEPYPMEKPLLYNVSIRRILLFLAFVLLKLNAHSQSISGTVFRDFNSNGLKDNSTNFNEIGAAKVLVCAYRADGSLADSSRTNDSGFYTLNVGAGSFRIEFKDFPKGLFSSFQNNNQTSVQFKNGGDSNANLGINAPNDYCQSNPSIATSCYLAGNVDGHVFVTFPYNFLDDTDGDLSANYTDAGSPASWIRPSRLDPALNPTSISENSEIGTVFGIAYDRIQKVSFAGAFIKRKAKLGVLGNESTGAIYKISNSTDSLWVDLNALFSGSAGTNPHPTNSTDWNDDQATNQFVYKRGLGDVEISNDYKKIFAINLGDDKLYTIPTDVKPTGSNITSIALPNSGIPLAKGSGTCPTNDVRHFGLGKDIAGNLYVGGVCTAETSQDAADLSMYVWRFDGTNFSLILNEKLDYRTISYKFWKPWNNTDNQTVNSQPQVGDIEFDVDGSMIIGLRDRYGDMTPMANKRPDEAPYPRTGGDILRVCYQNGIYKLEANGSCGGVTTVGFSPTGEPSDGPGGAEFYFEDTSGDADHESSQGSLLMLAGRGEVISTAFDAVVYNSAGQRNKQNYNTGGLQKYSNQTGAMTGAYDVFLANDLNTFGKTSGLGDIELMCDVPPIEIGNRVWKDLDEDGIQDAGEPALVGVTVRLFDKNGSEIASTVTNGLGGFYFNSQTTNSLKANLEYKIKVTSLGSDASVSGLNITAVTNGGVSGLNNGNSLANNDAVLEANLPTISLKTGNWGENNHTYDFGFKASVSSPTVCSTNKCIPFLIVKK